MSGSQISAWSAVRHGLAGRCPKCGQGKLFRSYLKAVEMCGACGEMLGRIRADDGPAWLTILVVGHIVVGLTLLAETQMALPLWVSIAGFSALTLVMCLAFLPRAKGIFIGAIWAMKAPGS